nr:tetratricopeptide repeat protein [Gammaproteobacteria bacterium]
MHRDDNKQVSVNRLRRLAVVPSCLLVGLLMGCGATQPKQGENVQADGRVSADQLLPVDCLLPAQMRKLGTQMTYLAPRRAIKTTALDCEIRGGEYVAYDRADYRTSLNVWLEKAQQGDPQAQTYVGEIYEKGLGLPNDYQTARTWYSKAAEQGYSRAQINLGYLYEKGLGVEQDRITALNWYRRASGVTDDELDYA